MRVIATAGHVDHGKSELVLALTGIDPDRLQEEQEREMTIDLGFAWLDLADGDRVGIVDVPGHRDFIENMLAGVGGVDGVLFVIAADEGVMPQTQEHLGIIDLLGIERGVIALSKIDLVQDPDWLGLAEEEVRELLAGSSLEDAPVVRVSAKTGVGLEQVRSQIGLEISEAQGGTDLGRPRLPVDRAFTISGFGTVVTGTLQDGRLLPGQEVEVLPAGRRARIRGLQSHGDQIEAAEPSSRVAINLAAIDVSEIERGDVVALPATYDSTRRIDVKYRALQDIDVALQHDMQVKLFLGSAQRIARVRLMGTQSVFPGQEAWLQLELQDPIVAARGDRYILRRPSPPTTIGGGQVADPHPPGRHRLRDERVLRRLERLLSGSQAQVLLGKMDQMGIADEARVIAAAGIPRSEGLAEMRSLIERGEVILIHASGGTRHVASRNRWGRLRQKAERELDEYHQRFPLRMGIPREELKSRLRLERDQFQGLLSLLEEEGHVVSERGRVRKAEFGVLLDAGQQRRVRELLRKFEQEPYSPPSVKDAQSEVGAELLEYLLQSGKLVQVAPDVVFSGEAYQSMVELIPEMIQDQGAITVAELRDRLSTSRKYALAMLEHSDEIGLTVRVGDERRLAETP